MGVGIAMSNDTETHPPEPAPPISVSIPKPDYPRMVCSYCGTERGGPGQRSPRFCPKDTSGQHWHNFVDSEESTKT